MNRSAEPQVNQIRRFNRFYTNIIGLINQNVLESPYSLAEARVMLEINNNPNCTASEITRLLQIDPGYLSRILRRFKKAGLINTTKSEIDGRAQLVTLSETGKYTYSQLSAASDIQLAKILEHIPNGIQQQLIGHMAAIQAILSEKSNDFIIIRNYRPGDLGYIAYRHGVLYANEYGLDQVFEKYVLQSLIKCLENPSGYNIWVAECCGSIIGFIGMVEIDKTTAQLRWFLLEPEFRGGGLGRKLLAAAMDYCRWREYGHVFLWTFKGLDAARHLYEDFGFTLTDQKENNTWKNQLVEQRWDVTLEN